MRAILIRFAVPTLIAVSILAFFGVPYVDRILAEWFRSDVDLRAQLVAHSMEGSLTGFLERDDKKGLAQLSRRHHDRRASDGDRAVRRRYEGALHDRAHSGRDQVLRAS